MKSGEYHLILKKLHNKYGPVVRIGPNLLDLDYPELSKTLYGTDEAWRKVGCDSSPIACALGSSDHI